MGDLPTPVTSKWPITAEDLVALNESKDPGQVAKLGGVEGLARTLQVDLEDGISKKEVDSGLEDRFAAFLRNTYPEPPRKTLFKLFLMALNDTTLIILIVAAVISLLLGVLVLKEYESGWYEGTAILAAVLIVSVVTAVNDYSKELQFRKLNKVKDDKKVSVMRNGAQQQISIFDVTVGDIVVLESGDAVPADGIFISGVHFEVDESVMTGESMTVKKSKSAPFMLSGCQIVEGFGRMIVTAVGVNSEWGQTLAKLVDERESTPLQKKLDRMADLIGKVGLGMAILTFIALVIRWIIFKVVEEESIEVEDLGDFVDFFILAVTIVVVAVPEGLPLAVTISLAYSMRRMMDDNNLVRHLEACETMGGATNICSDKTGTLTENKMTVVQGWFAGRFFDKLPVETELPSNLVKYIGEGAAVNSKAFITAHEETGLPIFVGNKTECALLMMASKWGQEYKAWRAKTGHDPRNVYPFNADRKRMSTLISYEGISEAGAIVPEITPDVKFRIYVKGASEIVLRMCTHYIDSEGRRSELTEVVREELRATIDKLAGEALRTIVMAHRDFAADGGEEWEEASAVESDLTFDGLMGIKDPLRPEVPDAVLRCQEAGIFVRMVTGDNIITAKTIARECGILTEGGMALEGPVFRQMPDEEVDRILPKLQVLARSSPTDKYRLVNRLKKLGEVVAVTGDGTNDAAALKEADVGLSMGLSGTEVAKEASDIVILDDNFSSIVKACLWGRSVYDNIRKFLQFQLTVNLVALTVAFVGSITNADSPLNAVQLLWVNLIMDTLAALALATEGPSPDMLKRKPYGRYESLISPIMVRNMLTQCGYQLVVLFGLLYFGESIFGSFDYELEEDRRKHGNTIVFNAFVYCQVFNEINSRKVNNELNVFQDITKSSLFLVIFFTTAIVQFGIVQWGGNAMETVPLPAVEWIVTVLLGSFTLPLGYLFRMIPPVCYVDKKSPAYLAQMKQETAEMEALVKETLTT